MSDETPTVELLQCLACSLPVELGTCCRGCGVYFGDPCPACGQPGFHAAECSEIKPREAGR